MPNTVTLTFNLDEDVTPYLFAAKVAQACAHGTLRAGESISIPGTPGRVLRVTGDVEEIGIPGGDGRPITVPKVVIEDA